MIFSIEKYIRYWTIHLSNEAVLFVKKMLTFCCCSPRTFPPGCTTSSTEQNTAANHSHSAATIADDDDDSNSAANDDDDDNITATSNPPPQPPAIHPNSAPRSPQIPREFSGPYVFEMSFGTLAAARQFVTAEKTWTQCHIHRTAGDRTTKTYYACSRRTQTGRQCAASVYLRCAADDCEADVSLYRSTSVHDCHTIVTTPLRRRNDANDENDEGDDGDDYATDDDNDYDPIASAGVGKVSQDDDDANDTGDSDDHDESDDDNAVGDEEDASNDPPKAARPAGSRRTKHGPYAADETFANADAAELFVSGERCWSQRYRHTGRTGDKAFYRCNRVKARGQQCNASVYLWRPTAGATVTLYRSVAAHNCDTIATKAGSLMTAEVRRRIEEMAEKKMKPADIAHQLGKVGLPVPKRYQIGQHVAKMRRELYGWVPTGRRGRPRLLKQSEWGVFFEL